jgi:hypothetical protein
VALDFPYDDTMIQYLKGQWTATQDRRVIGALVGHMRRTYPVEYMSPQDYYEATCQELGAAV